MSYGFAFGLLMLALGWTVGDFKNFGEYEWDERCQILMAHPLILFVCTMGGACFELMQTP